MKILILILLTAPSLLLYKPGRNTFCPVNPEKYEMGVIKDSISKYCDLKIKAIKDYFLCDSSFLISIDYYYCEINSKKDVKNLKNICKKIMQLVKYKFSEIKKKQFQIRGQLQPKSGIPFGENCKDYVGIELTCIIKSNISP